MISGNGPQFTADEFTEFSRKWDFEHLTSSPGNSKANGKAESGVNTVKRILKKSIRAGTDPYLAVLDYRNTPTQVMTTSPAQRLTPPKDQNTPSYHSEPTTSQDHEPRS